MEWEAITALAALVGVAVTFGLNLWSNRLTRQGQEQDHAFAEAAASRAEKAAQISSDHMERLIDAIGELGRASPLGGAVAGPPPRVRWSLVHHGGDTYRLTNEGDLGAEGVELSSDETLRLVRQEGGPDLGPGEALIFMAAAHLGTRDRTITVSYRAEGGEDALTWRYPLPSRPPRR